MIKVLVIGAGAVGLDAALACALGGLETTLQDQSDTTLKQANVEISKNLKNAVELGKITLALRDETLRLLTFTTSLDSAAPVAELVIEALPDDFDLKRDLFLRLNSVCPKDTVFATTSTLFSIGKMTQISGRPDRMVGFRLPLKAGDSGMIEIALGPQTSDEALRMALEVARRMNRTTDH